MKTYEPTPSDIRWTQMLIDSLNDGGHWSWIDNEQVFQIDKEAKTLTLIAGLAPFDTPDLREDWEQLRINLAKCGYTLHSKLIPESPS